MLTLIHPKRNELRESADYSAVKIHKQMRFYHYRKEKLGSNDATVSTNLKIPGKKKSKG